VVRCLTEPIRDVEMSTIVPGTVANIHYGEGNHVRTGEIVIELESRSEKIDIERRSVLSENLQATLERSEMLLANTSSISMEEVDEARSEYRISKLELDLAREALNKKQVKAPFDGVVTELPLEVGEYCEPPEIILRLVDTSRFYCVSNIDPSMATGLKLNDPVVYIAGNGFGGSRLPGEIVFISPVVDPASGLLRIKAVFANPEGLIRPGEGGFLELPEED